MLVLAKNQVSSLFQKLVVMYPRKVDLGEGVMETARAAAEPRERQGLLCLDCSGVSRENLSTPSQRPFHCIVLSRRLENHPHYKGDIVLVMVSGTVEDSVGIF